MCQDNCCSPFWAVFMVLAQLASLSSPWYVWTERTPLCGVEYFMSWSKIYTKPMDSASSLCAGPDFSWREACDSPVGHHVFADRCHPMVATMNSSVAFASLSLLASLVVAVLSFMYACRTPAPGAAANANKGPSKVTAVFLWIGFVCSIVSTVAFSAGFTHAWKAFFGSCSDRYPTMESAASCPASSLIGFRDDHHDMFHEEEGRHPEAWMPVGYWVQAWVTVCYICALFTWYAQRSKHAARSQQTRLVQHHVVSPGPIYNLQQQQQPPQQQVPYGMQPVQQPYMQQQPQQYAPPNQSPMALPAAPAPPGYPTQVEGQMPTHPTQVEGQITAPTQQ